MRRLLFFLAAILIIGVSITHFGCQLFNKHFISDNTYRLEVKHQFAQVKEIAKFREKQLFAVFDQNLTRMEKEALEFLYASMPLCDLADGNGDLFLQDVRIALATRDSLPWGREIPEDVFRHFVLPYRVNNENLDSARVVFFKELLPRVRNMSLRDAALEVNHWCHEKVTYQPTDSRTISPLSAVKTAYGRCGEESTFAVTALRAVGIPARQVYTPRWAHTDDNHAWVEVWVDGKWYFMGACEPEPELNMGWFAEPVLRAMMVHTNTFGKYHGSDPVLEQNEKSSKLNLLGNYTETRELVVQVKDTLGDVAPHAYVEFGLYNYAEFYPLKKVHADENGLASLTTGYGDLQVLASDSKGNLGLKHVKAQDHDTVDIVLRNRVDDDFGLTFLNVPPMARKKSKASPEGVELNKKRWAQEDSLRHQYESTFIGETEAKAFAERLNLDTGLVWRYLKESRGNWIEIMRFLESIGDSDRAHAMDLLGQLAEKDFHDIGRTTLADHLGNHYFGVEPYSKEIFLSYVLNPRIELEMITPYRSQFQKKFGELKKVNANGTVQGILEWMKQILDLDTMNNYYNIPLTPMGVFELRRCDARSRDIFFVAVARSLGIPARLEPALRVPQYFNGEWVDVNFDKASSNDEQVRMASLYLEYEGDDFDPEYYIHFTLAKWEQNRFVTLEYDWNKSLSSFPTPIQLKPGYYRILTGHRNADGSVGVSQSFIPVGEWYIIEYEMTFDNTSFEWWTHGTWSEAPAQSDSLAIFAWLDPNTEPGKHFLNEIQGLKSEYERRKIEMCVYCFKNADAALLKSQLPANAKVLVDDNRSMLKSLEKSVGEDQGIDLPLFLVLNQEKKILFIQSGYNIGTPEWLLRGITSE